MNTLPLCSPGHGTIKVLSRGCCQRERDGDRELEREGCMCRKGGKINSRPREIEKGETVFLLKLS